MKKIFLPIVLCVLMAISSLLLACTPIGEHTHNLVWKDEVKATCVQDGIQGHNVCTICGYWFDKAGNKIDEEDCVIDATGEHTFKDGKCTVCDTPDPNWKGDEPEPTDQLAWLKGEWKEEVETDAVKPWTVTFDGKELKISFYRDDELQVVTAASFEAEGDDKVIFTIPNGSEGQEFSIVKLSDRRITLTYGNDTKKTLVKQGEPENPDTEYAIGMREVVKAGFALDKYENVSSGMYFDFGSDRIEVGKQIDINYSYYDASSTPAKLVTIKGVHNIKEATLLSTGTAYIIIEGVSSGGDRNRLSWSGPAITKDVLDWMGTNGRADIAWINYNDDHVLHDVDHTAFSLTGGEYEFPEATKDIEGVWEFVGDVGGDRVETEMAINVEDNTVTYTETTTYGTAGLSPKTSSLNGYFDSAIECKDNSGHTFFMMEVKFPTTQGTKWFRYNPYNSKLIEGPVGSYKVFEQPNPNRPIPFAGALPADLKGEYISTADGKYVFTGKNVVFAPASGDAISYVVTKLENGANDTTKKVTLAVANDKKTTIELTYDLMANTLTNGEKVYKGEELFVTPAENVPETLVGTYEYVGDNSNLSYVFDNDENYKVTRTEVSGEYIFFYATAYDATSKTLTLTEVHDLETGHIINTDGKTPEIVKMVYDETEKTVTVKGESADLDKVFKESAANLAAKVPEDIGGTYYIEGKAKYIDIIEFNVVLKGFAPTADKKIDGEYGIYKFDEKSGVLTLKAKNASETEEYVTLTLTDKKFTYGSETFTKGRPVNFTGEFYSLDAKYTINGNEITEEKVDGTTKTYVISDEKEEKATYGDKHYGWAISATEKEGTGTLPMWYDYIIDACRTRSTVVNVTYIRKTPSSTAGVPSASQGTYFNITKSGTGSAAKYTESKLTVTFTTGDHAEGTIVCGTNRYFIDRYDDANKQIIAKFGSTEYKFAYDATKPDEIKDTSNKVYTRDYAITSLPAALQADGSFFCKTETIDFVISSKVVKFTAAKGKDSTTGKDKKSTPVDYIITKYSDGVITLKPFSSGEERTIYYDVTGDSIKLTKDGDVYAIRPCEKAAEVSDLRGTFKNATRSFIFDGTAEVVGVEGKTNYQYIVKSFNKDEGKIVLFAGGTEDDIEFTYDSKTSTLTAGEDDVYTLDSKLPVGIDGTYKNSGGKQIVIYMTGIVFSGGTSSENGSFAIVYNGKSNGKDEFKAAPDNESRQNSFYFTVESDGSLTITQGSPVGPFTKEQTAEPEPEPEEPTAFPDLEGLSGEYFGNKDLWKFEGVKVTITPVDGVAASWTITKSNGEGEFTLQSDADSETVQELYYDKDKNRVMRASSKNGEPVCVAMPETTVEVPALKDCSYLSSNGYNRLVFDGTARVLRYYLSGSSASLSSQYYISSYDANTGLMKMVSSQTGSETSFTIKADMPEIDVSGTQYKKEGVEQPKFDVSSLPDYIFGKYTNGSDYIEIRRDGTATFSRKGYGVNGEWVIVNWDGVETLTMNQVSGGSFTDMKFYWKQESGKTILTYDQRNYTKTA